MNGIQTERSAEALVRAIKANMFAYFRYLGRSPSAELYEDGRQAWLLTGVTHPFLNCVLRIRVASHEVEATIQDTLSTFRAKDVSQFSWWIEPDSQPANLGEHLAAHGLAYTEGARGMAVDLAALEAVEVPAGLTIKQVGGAATLREWVRAASRGFALDSDSESASFDLFDGLGFDLPLRNYAGYLEGEPVATAELFLAAGVAGIYWVATVPEARRRGIGAAMTLAPLREAQALGYRVGILHSAPMGFGVYRSLGFREYCRMSHYYQMGEAG
jgi:ribosomal protein S18 acetylase RimI-like enzyme